MKQASVAKKQAEYLAPRIFSALGNTDRRKILDLLIEAPRKLAFDKIQEAFPDLEKDSLLNDLTVLQMADLIERSVKSEERRKNPDPYYAFYQATSLGKYVNQLYRKMVKDIEDFFTEETA